MPIERAPTLIAVSIVLLAIAGCAGRRPGGAEAASTGGTTELLPLVDGTVLAYETESEPSGERGIIVLQVSRPRPGLVELDDGGEVRRLELEPGGVRLGSGGHWLKEPLRPGACWRGRAGETCVTAVGLRVSVPAGRFAGCVRTLERAPGSSRVTTVFCPGVGMVSLEVEGEIDGAPARERALLKSHGPRVDVNAD